MIDKIGGRKFVYTLLLTIIGFIFVLIGKMTAKEYLDFCALISGIYIVGNVATKFTNNKQ
ncbi:MAG: hypothetical protein QXL18_05590 [Candidatus Woesearchaeota archaeon]